MTYSIGQRISHFGLEIVHCVIDIGILNATWAPATWERASDAG